jgi:F-type H+-transporting ATPase subunit gamma
MAGELDEIHIFYTRFVNSMVQEAMAEQLVPLTPQHMRPDRGSHSWDYITEPDPQTVIDELVARYVEAMIYRALVENMASEQSARRVAMKAASDNAGNVIDELKLVYNKTRQAAITREISEIVSGAAAV